MFRSFFGSNENKNIFFQNLLTFTNFRSGSTYSKMVILKEMIECYCRLLCQYSSHGAHWTYCLYFHSNYCTHSLYHFEKPAIVATKSYIFIFMHVKPIKVTSGFNLRVMKKIRQVALSYRKIKNKYEKADISTIDADPGVPRVSKDAPGST